MLNVIRAMFVILAGLIGWYVGSAHGHGWFYGSAIGMTIALAFVLLEYAFTRRFVSIISTVMFGVVVGFVVAFFFLQAFYLIPTMRDLDAQGKQHLEFCVTFLFSFIAAVAIIHSKDDFKFVIPFIELSREGKSGRQLILDTSVIIDGRIAELCDTGVIDSPIVVPRFVLLELQGIADSSDKLKRARGRRGLDILNRMRKCRHITVEINDAPLPQVEEVDSKLVRLAKMIDGKVVTNDFNLNKVAQVQGVDVINVNDIATAVRPVVLQGENLYVKIVRQGESPGQGVGYLDDGTMVVVEEASGRVGDRVTVTVSNILQTSAGKMIFGRTAAAPSNNRFSPPRTPPRDGFQNNRRPTNVPPNPPTST